MGFMIIARLLPSFVSKFRKYFCITIIIQKEIIVKQVYFGRAFLLVKKEGF